MASDPFFSAVIDRRSNYTLSPASTISDARIQEIVEKAILHLPSSYNVQSTRIAIVLKDEHRKFWDVAAEQIKATLPEKVAQVLLPKAAGLRNGYGSILFFEDQSDLTALKNKHASAAPFVDEWANHSSGIHQFAVWTAFQAEGLGANLQHYQFLPGLIDLVHKEWNIPQDWQLKAQLIFGTPTAKPAEKVSKPVEGRIKVLGQ